MKRDQLHGILENSNIKSWIHENVNPTKIRANLLNEYGESKCPSRSAIVSYIEKNFNLCWDAKNLIWFSYQNATMNDSKGKKKKSTKTTTNLLTFHESEIPTEDTIQNNENESDLDDKRATPADQKNIPKECTQSGLSSVTKNEEDIPTIDSINITEKPLKKRIRSESAYAESLSKLVDKNISPAEYGKYMALYGEEKESISMNRFIREIVEQRISETYNIKRQGNHSKIIRIALLEYLRLTSQ